MKKGQNVLFTLYYLSTQTLDLLIHITFEFLLWISAQLHIFHCIKASVVDPYIYIYIREGKNGPEKQKIFNKFHLLKC
jgi:hypothetical protein